MQSVAVYPVHFYCPKCRAPGSAEAQESHTESGEDAFSLLSMNGFTSKGITATQSGQRVICSCGHEFAPELVNGASGIW